ncbi:plasmid replication protein, CyRepA1 family [Coleofasciculus sp. E1-EBD-02]|uniref:plasmid replication protein, CyRepA1 family n=1 Tax=Coleofasciculus sp. E1-EBD-02 TaxID=3068481 RepID=UPI0032FBA077
MLKLGLIPSSTSNPCPICDNTSGKCRQGKKDPDYWQCMTFAGTRKGETCGNWKCLGDTSDQMWAQFKPDNSTEWTEERRREWEAQKQARREKAQREQARTDAQRLKRALSAIDRDKGYRRLLRSLELSPLDRENLIRRGMNPTTISSGLFRSVEAGQLLDGFFLDNRLPGISSHGEKLVTEAGYLCPIPDLEERIIGCQIRLRQPKEGEGRYRWLSSKQATLHLPIKDSEGKTHLELPIGVYRPRESQDNIVPPLLRNRNAIALAEGTGAKPWMAADLLGIPVIGAAGGMQANSPIQLKQYIDGLARFNKPNLLLIPDAGDVINPQVMRRWRRLSNLLQSWGYGVQVLWWGQTTKAMDDIDEIGAANFQALQASKTLKLLTPKQFQKLAQFQQRQVREEALRQKNWKLWVSLRRYTSTHVINQPYFEFPDDIPTEDIILAGKSGLGTGKTSALIRMIVELNRGSRLIGYRNNLLHQTIARFEATTGKTYHHIQDLNREDKILLADPNSHVAFCLDSITHCDPYDFYQRVVVLDETVSVLLHGMTAGTLGNRQSEALSMLREALQLCSVVICLDGNLRDIDIDLIQKLSGDKQVVKIKNDHKPEPHRITFVTGMDADGELRKRDRSPLVRVLLAPGCRPWIATDSKDRSKALYQMLTARGLKGFVLNSENTKEDWAKEFLSDPSGFIQFWKPDFMIISPSAESGLDVHSGGHFTHKFTFFSGVLMTNGQNQIMFRLRDNLPHYVFCPLRGLAKDRNTPKTYVMKEFGKASDSFTLASATMAAQVSSDPTSIQAILSALLENTDLDYWNYSIQIGAIDNFESDNLRECLMYALSESGHIVEEENWLNDEDLKAEESEAFQTVQRIEAKEIYEAEDIPFEQAQVLKRKDGKKDVKRKVQKAFFLHRLPGIKESEVWNKPIEQAINGLPLYPPEPTRNSINGGQYLLLLNKIKRDWLTSLERLYLLQNYEIAKKRHEQRWFSLASKSELVKMEAKRRSREFPTIWALKELGIERFLEGEYCVDSPELIDLEETGKRPDIILALGIAPGKPLKGNAQRIRYLGKLLSLIGIRLDNPIKRGTTNRKNYYKVITNLAEARTTERILEKGGTIPLDYWAIDQANPLRIAAIGAISRKMTEWMHNNSSELEWNPQQPEIAQVTAVDASDFGRSASAATEPVEVQSNACESVNTERNRDVEPTATTVIRASEEELKAWDLKCREFNSKDTVDQCAEVVKGLLPYAESWNDITEVVDAFLSSASEKAELKRRLNEWDGDFVRETYRRVNRLAETEWEPTPPTPEPQILSLVDDSLDDALEEPLSKTQVLINALSKVKSVKQFWQTIRGYDSEVIEDAIIMQDTTIARQTMTAWFSGDDSNPLMPDRWQVGYPVYLPDETRGIIHQIKDGIALVKKSVGRWLPGEWLLFPVSQLT